MRIQLVGIKDIQIPTKVLQKQGGSQNTIATIDMEASLPHSYLGSSVETFTRILNESLAELSFRSFSRILQEVQQSLHSETAQLKMTFPYFLEKKAPVSQTTSLMEYRCAFTGNIEDKENFIVAVTVPVTTLCPCSKEISKAGAHNQRAEVEFQVTMKRFLWLEDLIALVEQSASCDVYALLKRPDEKYVTERAFNNPMFVEDVVRKIAEQALAHPDIDWFSVGVESFESIHNHSAYAYVDSTEILKSRPHHENGPSKEPAHES